MPRNPHSGFDLIDGEDIDLEETLGTDHTWTGITTNGQARPVAGLAFADFCYLNADGKWDLVDADAAATVPCLAMCTEALAQDAFGRFLLMGFVRDDTWGWTPGDFLYSHTTAGDITDTAPAGAGDQVHKCGIAITSAIIYFNPDLTIVQVV